MTKYRKEIDPPSEMFLSCLADSNIGFGSDEATCGWCNRLHLCPDNRYDERDNMDRKQFKEYCEEEFKNNPEGTVLNYDCDSIIGYNFNGILFILDCPCNGLGRYEKFIWNEKEVISKYLNRRIQEGQTIAKLKGTSEIDSVSYD